MSFAKDAKATPASLCALAAALGAMSAHAMILKRVLITFFLFASQANITIAACNIVDGKAYGDCGDVKINTSSKPLLEVRGQVSESSIIDGATVYSGASLLLSGISNGNIRVLSGGRLTVSGVVNGEVRNEG